jgi:fatty acid desaturase
MGLSLAGGAAASGLIVTAAPEVWPLLVLSWMVTVHGARKGQVVINHHAVHTNVTGQKRYDQMLAEVVSTLLLIQDYRGYFGDHVRVHHDPKQLATPADPDLQFLLLLGFRPGMRREALWRRLYWTLVSPRFHSLFLRARLKANYVTAPVYRRIMAGCYAAAVVAGLALTGAWLPWVVAWVVPVFPLYHVAALLQFICEHNWLQVQERATSHERENA